MSEHNALGYWLGLALCLTKLRSSRARCPATALIYLDFHKISVCCTIIMCLLTMILGGLYQQTQQPTQPQAQQQRAQAPPQQTRPNYHQGSAFTVRDDSTNKPYG